MVKKKAAGKKKKKGTSKKKAASTGPSEPIVPKVCTNCAALYTPVKDGKECALCTQAKESNALFSSLSASIAARANGEDTLPPLKEESTAAAAGDDKKKKGTKKKKAGSVKKKKSSIKKKKK